MGKNRLKEILNISDGDFRVVGLKESDTAEDTVGDQSDINKGKDSNDDNKNAIEGLEKEGDKDLPSESNSGSSVWDTVKGFMKTQPEPGPDFILKNKDAVLTMIDKALKMGD